MSKVEIDVAANGATATVTFSGEGTPSVEDSGKLTAVKFYAEPGKPKVAGYVRTEAVLFITVEQDD